MESEDWNVPKEDQPNPSAYVFDLKNALKSIVALRVSVPDDAHTAESLGTERIGHGVVIREDGLVLTIGYLILEAEDLWLTTYDGRAVRGHAMAFDHESGLGLVQPLSPIGLPPLSLGDADRRTEGEKVVVAAAGGIDRCVAAQIVARQEFAGYWEYLLDDALFTAPAHPSWGGTAVIASDGTLIAIGSLQLHYQAESKRIMPLNMSVPVNRLRIILDELLEYGEGIRPPRPWLGVYSTLDADGEVTLVGVAAEGPAKKAELRAGDIIRAVNGQDVNSLAQFYRAVWAMGPAGVDIPLTVEREGDIFDMVVGSADRNRYLKTGRRH